MSDAKKRRDQRATEHASTYKHDVHDGRRRAAKRGVEVGWDACEAAKDADIQALKTIIERQSLTIAKMDQALLDAGVNFDFHLALNKKDET